MTEPGTGQREGSLAGPGLLPGGLGPALPFDRTWCLVAPPDAEAARVAESLLCLSDGMVGTRGVLEDSVTDEPDGARTVLVGGLYEPAVGVTERLVALPAWCKLPLRRAVPRGRRVLDLRDGVLVRMARGSRSVLCSARFACATRPGTGVLVAEVDPALLARGGDSPTVSVVRSTLGGAVARAVATSPVDPGAGFDGPTDGGGACSTVVVERVVAHAVSTRRRPLRRQVADRLEEAVALGGAGLLGEQRAKWSERWSQADVEILGDPDMTLALRFALFHLLSAAGRRGETAVGARGLTGSAYAGHVFWDTDVFVLPVLAAVDRPAARTLLEYRLRRLDPARLRAAREGRAGARFPWESAHGGHDVTPRSGMDQHGDIVPIRTGALEEHVTADVAWAAWRYAAWDGRWGFLDGPGRALLTDTARYWFSRIRRDGSGRAHIDGVIGPDEYHEDVDDNAFTNLMARWNLRRAAHLVERLAPPGPAADEAAAWREAADALVDGHDPRTGRYEQFAGYDRLEPLLATDLGCPPLAADLMLAPGRLARSQVIKQADVLMAHLLVPEEVAPGSLEPNLDHYLPRTAHGSSLSPAVHASVAARAGRPDAALELLRIAASIDLEDLTETTAGGLHLANFGGMWQAVVHGFAGLRVTGPDDETLAVDPCLPEEWEELRLRVRWHRRLVALSCRHDGVGVECDRPLAVSVRGTTVRVEPPGAWVS